MRATLVVFLSKGEVLVRSLWFGYSLFQEKQIRQEWHPDKFKEAVREVLRSEDDQEDIEHTKRVRSVITPDIHS